MALLEAIFVVGLLFEVGNSQDIFIYSRPGEDVILPCSSQNQPQQCSDVSWIYSRDSSPDTFEAERGWINPSSPRAGRMSLGSDCSLAIKNVSAEDVGRFSRRQGGEFDIQVYLSLLSISPVPADFDPETEELSLECSLKRYSRLSECRSNPLRWLDERRVPKTEDVSQDYRGADCLSYLTVKRQSGNNRKFTCIVVNKENRVETEADYTPSFRDPTQNPGVGPGSEADPGFEAGTGPGSDAGSGSGAGSGFSTDQNLIFIIVGVLVGVVLLLIIMAVLLIKHKKRDKVADVIKPTQHPDDPESNLTYVTVNHSKQQPSSNVRAVDVDAVTYSTVKYTVKMGKDDDPSSLYGNISKN